MHSKPTLPDTTMTSSHWLTYFRTNRLNRPDPQWHLPVGEDTATAAALARSLSHFQLGESGEGRCLLTHARRVYWDDPDYCEALALFIQEEKEHARLLARLVARVGGQLIGGHWTHAIFRTLRRAIGVHFEIEVLVIAELVGTAYYRLLQAGTHDPVIGQVCGIVLRDEAQHVAFHAERFADAHSAWLPLKRALWTAQFRCLFLGAALVAWIDHGPALRAIGARRREFFNRARSGLASFLGDLSPAKPVAASVAPAQAEPKRLPATSSPFSDRAGSCSP